MSWTDPFTLQSLCLLLVSMGYAALGASRDGLTLIAAITRMTAMLGAAMAAFILVGNAVLRGHDDVLLSLARESLYGRGIDGSAAFHGAAITVGVAIIAAGARSAPLWAVVIAGAAYGGLIAPVAMRQTWWGLLRSVGLIDTGGAIAIHLCAAAVAMALARMFTLRAAGSVAAAAGHQRPFKAALAAICLTLGYVALARLTAVMQSPATVENAVTVLVIGACAGAAAAYFRSLFDSAQASGVVATLVYGAIAGAVATTAGAGRLPWWVAGVAGIAAAAGASPVAAMLRAFFGERIDYRLVASHIAGGLVAVVAAVPAAIHADGKAQLAIHVVSALSLAGLATCAGVIVLGIGKLLVELMRLIARAATPRTDSHS